MISVRPASRSDAREISLVLVASITELCTLDHQGNARFLEGWLANKTPEHVATWLDNPTNRLFVAQRDGDIAGVGGINEAREIILNYVAPRHRFSGVSKALLSALEKILGPGGASLTSTITALDFYQARGWTIIGEVSGRGGGRAFTLQKEL